MNTRPLLSLVLLVGALLLKFASVAQESAPISEKELQSFWGNSIQPIIDLDQEKIIEMTSFPLAGDWASAFELWEASDEELQEAYTSNPGVVFDEELRAMLSEMTWEDIVVNDYEEGVVLSIPVHFTYDMDGETVEFSVIPEFMQIEGVWMLIAIVYAG